MSSVKKILVMGFSVTAEHKGYVEIAETLSDWPEGVTAVKAAIGGLMPAWIKFFAADIIDRATPDAVVFELATPTFRNDKNLEVTHTQTVEWLLDLCHRRGLAAAFLDLPRTDVVQSEDWVVGYHAQIARMAGLVHRSVDGQADMFRDVVHPTPEGKELYARHFCDLARELVQHPKVPPSYDPSLAFFAKSLAQDEPSRVFSRAGFEAGVIDLQPGEKVVQQLEPKDLVRGISFLMGPRTGFFEVSGGGQTITIPAYDRHCYYERFGARLFTKPVVADEITITQTSALSDAVLLKGEPNTGPRLGSVAHLLIERDMEDFEP